MNQQVFDFSFNAFTAYYQAGMLCAGVAAFAIGMFFLGDFLYWRLHAEKVMGRITSVRQDGKFSYPVYHYTLANGQSYDATSSVGTGADSADYASALNPGGDVELMVFPDNPDIVRPVQGISGNIVFFIGLFVGSVGLLFIIIACTHYPFTKWTGIMLAGFVAYGVIHFQRIVFPQVKGVPLSQLRTLAATKERASMNALPIRPVAEVVAQNASSPSYSQQQLAQALPAAHKLHTIFLGAAYLFFFLALLKGYQTAHLVYSGTKVQGTVASIAQVWNSGTKNSSAHYDYYPVVTFTASSGETIRFQDKYGSSSNSYHPGDSVSVLYLGSDPQDAAIDHGWKNWAGPFGLVFAGGVLLFFAHKTSDGYVQRALSQSPQNRMAQQTSGKKQVAIICMLLGPILLVGGIYMGQKTLDLQRSGLHADGTVIELSSEMANHGTTYHAIVAFTAPDGRAIRFRDGSGSNPPMYHVGESVKVLYFASKPEQSATIDRGVWNWIGPAVLFAFGAIFTLIAPGMIRKTLFAPR